MVIGVQKTMLTVSEGEPALVCVNLTQGTLARDVAVKLTTMNGAAMGKTLYICPFIDRLELNCVLINNT